MTSSAMTAERVPIGKYVWAMLGVTVACGAGISAIEAVTGANLGTGAGVVSTLASTYVAAQMFVGDHKRVPEPGEKRRFATWGTIGTLAAFALFMIGYMTFSLGAGEFGKFLATIPGEIGRRPGFAAVIAASALVGILISFGLLYGLLSSFSKQAAKRLGNTTAG